MTGSGKAGRSTGLTSASLVASWQRWFAMVLIMFVLLAAVAVAFQPFLAEFVYERFFALRHEQRYGFRGARVPLAGPNGNSSVYVLAEITPGGPLDRAGFRVGDAPFGGFHSQSVYFLDSLSMACEYPDRTVSVAPVGGQGLELSESRTLRLPCIP